MRPRFDVLLLALLCVFGLATVLFIWKRRVDQERAQAEVDAREHLCMQQQTQLSHDLDAAAQHLHQTLASSPMQLAHIGEVIHGDAAPIFAAARTRASSFVVHSMINTVLSGASVIPEVDISSLTAAHDADLDLLLNVGHYEFVTPTNDLDASVYAGDHPYALPFATLVLLRRALAREDAAVCLREVIDVMRLRQVAVLSDLPGLADGEEALMRWNAIALDACAARANESQLAEALTDLRQLAMHPVPLDVALQLGTHDVVQDTVAFPCDYGPSVPEWMWCSQQYPYHLRRKLLDTARAAEAIRGCATHNAANEVVSWGECVRAAWATCTTRACVGALEVEPWFAIGDEQIWHRVAAIAVATRLHSLRGDLPEDGPPERHEAVFRDPFAGQPIHYDHIGETIELGFPRATAPLRLAPLGGPVTAARRPGIPG